eukprot:m.104962 g.104962  ORF g.104962 m.104962 type:complete len:596 (+) comp15772_c0_seq1:27-1814(+)
MRGRIAAALAVSATAAASFVHQRSTATCEQPANVVPAQIIQPAMPPSRQHQLSTLRSQSFDMVVIGGGATGAGVALDAVTRGLRVALIERDDFASGTSSKSTKLLHGGVRYLEKAVMKLDKDQFHLVEEALAERATALRNAPHLSSERRILVPIYKWYMVPYMWIGLKMYDIVSLFQMRGQLHWSRYLTPADVIQQFPMLNDKDLCGGIVYSDGQFNDAAMNVAVAVTAAEHGAVMLNHTEVTSFTFDASGRADGVVVRDCHTGDKVTVKAKVIVNAAGPFTDAVLRMENNEHKNIVLASEGTHVILPGYFCPREMGMLDSNTSDGRVVFYLPWEGHTLIGTTDTKCEVTPAPVPSADAVDFLLKEVSKYLSTDVELTRKQVLAAWTGVRPLVSDPKAVNTESVVRNHLVHVGKAGVVSIAGGKWTTYRQMAQETVDAAVASAQLPAKPCVTKELKLVGAEKYTPTLPYRLIQQYGMDEDVAHYLARRYGDRADVVASLAKANGFKRLCPHLPFLEEEVTYAVRYEYATSITDVFARRVRLAFLDCRAAKAAIPRIADLMAAELHWSSGTRKAEVQSALSFLRTMGLEILEAATN